ncbi:hypothetical protein BGZ63DRAFT_473199 [Mariannaea sp. PMI_226]|nr:hypothetical protein BGZ63DRAFT_473199 [Mariannaea sp. PMI_226]
MDPGNNTTRIRTVGSLALKASKAFHATLRSLRSQDQDARALKREVADLNGVLGSLLETIASNPTLDFHALEIPLVHCGHACEEYTKVIAQCLKHSEASRLRACDWITQEYLQGDINDFRAMLAIYKSTINITLANANLQIAVISPRVLANYKDMIFDTTYDLHAHLVSLQEKITRLAEWHAILEEKKSTQQSLDMCIRLSVQITKFESASMEHAHFSDRPSAFKYIKSGLGEARGSILSLIAHLQTHEALINSQLKTVALTEASSETVAVQLARLQQTKESINHCIQIVSEVGNSADERSKVFEVIPLANNSSGCLVLTVNDLVIARLLNYKAHPQDFGGQATNETIQKFLEALTKLDTECLGTLQKGPRGRSLGASNTGVRKPSKTQGGNSQFADRFGPGFSLSVNGKS